MDAYGWQFDSSISQGGSLACNISGHAFNCTCSMNSLGFSHPGYALPRFYNNIYQNAADVDTFVSNNHIPYAQPPVHLATTAPEAPISVCSVNPRVHVNPNYRPKLSSSREPVKVSSKPANVHINPHWKGRAESFSSLENGFKAGVSKKTIFLNPKVLAQMKVNSFNGERDETYPSDLLRSSTESKSVDRSERQLSDHYRVDNVCNNPDSNVQNDEHFETELEPAILDHSPEPAFVVLSSTKLVRRQNLGAQEKLLGPKQIAVKSSPHLSGIAKKVTSPNILKIAKQVSSKYKFVRCSPSVPNSSKITKCSSATPLRKIRRKSMNLKQAASTNPRSLYKFVRKNEDCKSTREPGPSKLVKKIFSNVPSYHNIHKNTSFVNVGSCSTSSKNVKSRYKLTRISAKLKSNTPASDKNMKTVQSRYKLVRRDLVEFMPSSKIFVSRNLPIPGSCSPSLISHKFRSGSENKSNPRRKVSRFRIIQASGSPKLKTRASQMVLKFSRYRQSPNLSKAGIRKPGSFGNMIWQKGKMLSSSQLCSNHSPLLHLGSTFRKRYNVCLSNKTSHKSLLNIGGVLYRSTRTTLTRTQPGESKEQVLNIRGKRYVLDVNGTTLRPASSSEDAAHQGNEKRKGGFLGRVDIGGVTFTRRNDNTLVRTNSHHARNLVSIAKMKSIALLTNKLRKNNEPCLLYNRFGRCNAKEKGKCWRVHDPKNIAICRKFLLGNCEVKQCLLSHAVGPEKMPTCRYYLEGCCVRDNCRYLHVKLNAHAGICREFLHGYCAAGDMCKKRHVYLCPDFEQNGKCSKGKCCPYPHKIKNKDAARVQKANYSAKHITKKDKSLGKSSAANTSSTLTINDERDKRVRYYDKSSSLDLEEYPKECSEFPKDSDATISRALDYQSEEESAQNTGPDLKRPKIGILPAYIPLE